MTQCVKEMSHIERVTRCMHSHSLVTLRVTLSLSCPSQSDSLTLLSLSESESWYDLHSESDKRVTLSMCDISVTHYVALCKYTYICIVTLAMCDVS